MLEALKTLILGHRVSPDSFPELPVGALPAWVVLREGRTIPRLGGILARMERPAAAVTLGRTIVLNPDVRLTPQLLTHELAHVRQWRRDRWFPIRYSLATLRYGYNDNPYEVEARQIATSEWPTRAGEERT